MPSPQRIYNAIATELAYQLAHTTHVEENVAVISVAYNLAVTLRNVDRRFDITEFIETALREYAEREITDPDWYIDKVIMEIGRSDPRHEIE